MGRSEKNRKNFSMRLMIRLPISSFEEKIAQFTATGFGIGHIPWASGTWGSLLAVLIAIPWLPYLPLDLSKQITATALMLCLFLWGCHASHVTGKSLGKADHSAIVWDEMVAMWWVLMLMPDLTQTCYVVGLFLPWIEPLLAQTSLPPTMLVNLQATGVAFLLFRFFDIIKPFPANWIDRHWHHGFGVMLDDLVAAIYSILVMWGITILILVNF